MVEIVPFEPSYADAFKTLNYAWITQLFEIEASDEQMLEHPEASIIKPGGAIFIGLLDGNPVGACALLKKSETHFELAKMAVSEEARGKQIGHKLGVAIIEKAKELGATTLSLETNSSLIPAIQLYKKLGFSESCESDSPYQRCDVQMEMNFA